MSCHIIVTRANIYVAGQVDFNFVHFKHILSYS